MSWVKHSVPVPVNVLILYQLVHECSFKDRILYNAMKWRYLIPSLSPKLNLSKSNLSTRSSLSPKCVQCVHFKKTQDVRFGKCGLFPKDSYGDPYLSDVHLYHPHDYSFCFIAWQKCQGKFYRDIR